MILKILIKAQVSLGATLTQLVKASVGQTDVQRSNPHLGYNLLSGDLLAT